MSTRHLSEHASDIRRLVLVPHRERYIASFRFSCLICTIKGWSVWYLSNWTKTNRKTRLLFLWNVMQLILSAKHRRVFSSESWQIAQSKARKMFQFFFSLKTIFRSPFPLYYAIVLFSQPNCKILEYRGYAFHLLSLPHLSLLLIQTTKSYTFCC